VRPSFEYDVWGLSRTSETGSAKAGTKVAKRKGWGEGIKPKPSWNITLCSGPDSQQSISEGLAPHQGTNFWYKKKRRKSFSFLPPPPICVGWLLKHLSWMLQIHFFQWDLGFGRLRTPQKHLSAMGNTLIWLPKAGRPPGLAVTESGGEQVWILHMYFCHREHKFPAVETQICYKHTCMSAPLWSPPDLWESSPDFVRLSGFSSRYHQSKTAANPSLDHSWKLDHGNR